MKYQGNSSEFHVNHLQQKEQAHAPKTDDEFRAAARRLIASGFTINTVAQVMRADIRAVRTLLDEDFNGR